MYMKDKKYSVRVRLSAVEFEFLQNLAKVHNSTMSSEVRACILQAMINNDKIMERCENGNK